MADQSDDNSETGRSTSPETVRTPLELACRREDREERSSSSDQSTSQHRDPYSTPPRPSSIQNIYEGIQ